MFKIISLLLFIFCSSSLYCVDFEFLKNYMLSHSKELNVKRNEVVILKKDRAILDSEYYPKLNLGINFERSKSLNDTSTGYIYGASITSGSLKKTYSSIGVDYNIYSFGRLTSKINTKENEIKTSNLSYCMNEKELVLSLLENYFNAISYKITYRYYDKIIIKINEQFEINKRLFEVGNIEKLELLKSSLSLANFYSKKTNNEIEVIKYLNKISYITTYSIKIDEALALLNKNSKTYNLLFENTINAKLLLSQIETKKLEESVIKKEYSPNINFYSKYDFYGSDENSFTKSIELLEKNSYKFGLSLSWEIFSGFKTSSKIEKNALELKQLYDQYDLEEYNFNNEISNLNNAYRLEKQNLFHLDKSMQVTKRSQNYSQRLKDIGEVDSLNLLNYEIEKLNKELAYKILNEKLAYLKLKKEIFMKDSTCTVP